MKKFFDPARALASLPLFFNTLPTFQKLELVRSGARHANHPPDGLNFICGARVILASDLSELDGLDGVFPGLS